MDIIRTVFGAAIAAALLLSLAPEAHAKPIYRRIDYHGNIVDMEPGPKWNFKLPVQWTGWKSSPGPNDFNEYRKVLPDGTALTISPYGIDSKSDRNIVCRNSFCGYADERGNLVIPAVYDHCDAFVNGMAAVELKGRTRIIDRAGETVCVLPPGLHADPGTEFQGVDENGLLPVKKDSGEDGGLFNIRTHRYVAVPGNAAIVGFTEGMSPLFNGDYLGYVDLTGKVAIPGKFEQAGQFHDGLAPVCLPGGHWMYINKSGKPAITLPPNCSYAGIFSEGLAAIAIGGAKQQQHQVDPSAGAKWGFINAAGKMVIPAQCEISMHYGFDKVEFHEGLAAVADKSGKLGYIDKHANWVVPPKYTEAGNFNHGSALVAFGKAAFTREEWQKRENGRVCRGDQFDLFVQRFKLIGLERAKVLDFLGRPDGKTKDCDEYLLVLGYCGSGTRSVEIRYNKQSIVEKYRYDGMFSSDPWIKK